ncbi:MAG: dGTP triphosphohydrolase [Cetobacterium sp.]|nr:dGTP triphosphohydrolase [Cetobacterium sp.]
MEKSKIIKDLVHDYIELDNECLNIIDTPEFQRLRRIRQLTSNYLFPSGNHSRFEHALGIMKLSMIFYEGIEESFEKERSLINDLKEKDYYKDNFKIASLLHELGEAPLSNIGNSFYNKEEIGNYLKIKCDELLLNYESIFNNEYGTLKERMTCYFILSKMYKIIRSNKYIDLEFILRMIIGNKYIKSEEDKNYWCKNIFIELLNGKTFDMQKLDSLMRDNYMCGYPAAKIDVKKLINSIYIKNHKISFKPEGISALQSLVDSRDDLYVWVYNHYIPLYTNYITEEIIRFLKGEINWQDYFSCEAITKTLITDGDIENLLNDKYRKFLLKEDIRDYIQNVLPQLYGRKFLKPVWKTVYEYNSFMENEIEDDDLIEKVKKELVEEKNRGLRDKILGEMREELGIKNGELFIIPSSNKYENHKIKGNILITVDGKEKSLWNILPQKDYKKMGSIDFYIYGPEERKKDIKKIFVKIIKNYYSL